MFTLKQKTLLVIAPHPDDEVIGCGGVIKRIKEEGGKVFVVFLTVGNTRDFTKRKLSTKNERQKEIKLVSKFLDFDNFHIVFPSDKYHLRLDLLGQKRLMDVIERDNPLSLEKIKPDIVAFPSPYSYNQDHRIVSLATHACLRISSKESKYLVPLVLNYEEPSDFWTLTTKLEPNFFVALKKNQLMAKLSAMKLYSSQLRPFPNPRSLEALKNLAVLRGSQCGSNFAEGFTLLRITV